jgi:hypothetical protein
VDVTERSEHGFTAIMVAAGRGHTETVKVLQAAGASITEKDDYGCSALHYAASYGNLSLLQNLLQEAGARISDETNDVETVWDFVGLQGADPVALTSLLKVMVMLDDAPPPFVVDLLAPAHAELATRGLRFRAQLPSYLEQQRASIFRDCPLPLVLLPIVAEYTATTPEDMWTDGLRIVATASDGGR